MGTETNPNETREKAWAKPVDKLRVGEVSSGAVNLNVEGRKVTSPVRGFGQLWQKTYRIAFMGKQVPPQEIIREWKANFPKFWPKGNRFYGVEGSITPGDVAVLNLAGPGGITTPGGGPVISTGIMVLYSDDVSFTFITPEGHMFAALITFSAAEESAQSVAQIQALIRASDPLFELTCRIGMGHKMEDTFWLQNLRNLAAYFGASGEPTLERVLVDPSVQWKEAFNIRWNSGIRTFFYTLAAPFRWIGSKLKRSSK